MVVGWRSRYSVDEWEGRLKEKEKETNGYLGKLPTMFLEGNWVHAFRLPLAGPIRCLNRCLVRESRQLWRRLPSDWGREVETRAQGESRAYVETGSVAGGKSTVREVMSLEANYRKCREG